MVHKEIQSKHLVQGQPFDVVYTVMNVGLECVPPALPFAFSTLVPCPCSGVVFFILALVFFWLPHPPHLFPNPSPFFFTFVHPYFYPLFTTPAPLSVWPTKWW